MKKAEMKRKRSQEVGKALTRMNYSKSGWKSMIKKTRRQILKNNKKGEIPESYKETMIEINKGWGISYTGNQWLKNGAAKTIYDDHGHDDDEQKHERSEKTILPLGDGITICRKI